MEIKTFYNVYELESLLPKTIPSNIKNMHQLFDTYGLKNKKEFPANSLVTAFIPLIFGNTLGSGGSVANVRDITNTLRTATFNSSYDAYAVGGQETNRGIVLGKGTTAVSLEDYKLETLISHGSGSNTLYYNLGSVAVSLFLPMTDSNSVSWSSLRVISNFSDSDIQVNEAGFYIRMSIYDYMIERTVLSPSYNFLAKTSVVFEYQSKVMV